MNGNKLSFVDYQIFLFKILLLMGLAWGGFALALAGFFYASVAWGMTLLFGILLIKLAINHRVVLKFSREMWIICGIFLLITITFSLFSTPTVFSGRDQGAISEAAIRLSQNHTFEFSTPTSDEFFKLHGPGRALNFPGFYYTQGGKLITQFPLVYITWLALFFSILGVKGLIMANAVLFYFFLTTLYLLIRLFIDSWASIPTMVFTATSFVFPWFIKFTLSENMALTLLWINILALMLFLKNQRRLHFAVLMLSSMLLCFTRIEGFAFLIASIIIIFCHEDTKIYIKSNLTYRFFLPVLFFLVAFAINAFVDINFYRELAKAILPAVKPAQAQFLGNLKNNVLPNFYSLKIFFIYGLLGFFVLGAFSIATYAWKKEYYKLMPFFVILPTFLYLFDSHITPDHPWMLRRYMFSLLPVAIFYSGLLLGDWLEKKPSEKNSDNFKLATLIISAVLLIGNLPSFLNFSSFYENKNLLQQTEKLSQKFSDNDLILIDQQASGDGWSMISAPMSSLYGKNAVYFFNIQDLSKLNLNSFENIYLIAPNEQVSYYLNSTIGKRLSETNEYSLNFSDLDVHKDNPLRATDFPSKIQTVAQGKIFKILK